jgi:hypothetical protein
LQDDFSAHLMGSSVNNQINKLGNDVDIIPGRYTESVQVLDKGLNKTFKGYLREQFEYWMCTNGSCCWSSRVEVAQWVARAWSQVRTSTIVNTWKHFEHKVDAAATTNYDKDNVVANQPGAGQDSTGDEEADDLILYQVEYER